MGWPVHRNSWAGPWLIWGVCTACRNATLSTTRASCGSSEDSVAPEPPCRSKLNGEPSRRGVPLMKAKRSPRTGWAAAAGRRWALQLRLGREQIQLRGPAGHGEADDPAGPGARPGGGQQLAIQQRGQRQRPHTRAGLPQQRPPADHRWLPSSDGGVGGADIAAPASRPGGLGVGQDSRVDRPAGDARGIPGGRGCRRSRSSAPAGGPAPRAGELALDLPVHRRLGHQRRSAGQSSVQHQQRGQRPRQRRAWTPVWIWMELAARRAGRAAGCQQAHRQQPQLGDVSGPPQRRVAERGEHQQRAHGQRRRAANTRPIRRPGRWSGRRPTGRCRRTAARNHPGADRRWPAGPARRAGSVNGSFSFGAPLSLLARASSPTARRTGRLWSWKAGRQLDAEEIHRPGAGDREQRVARESGCC